MTKEKTPGAQADGSNRRRKYLIHRKFQFTIIGFNLLIALLMLSAFFIENIYVFSTFTGPEYEELIGGSIFFELLEEDRAKMKIALLITSVVTLAVMVIGGLVLSNRVAGPVYRIRNHMDDVMSGKTDRKLKFRTKDFFPELAESYNNFLRRYLDLLRRK